MLKFRDNFVTKIFNCIRININPHYSYHEIIKITIENVAINLMILAINYQNENNK